MHNISEREFVINDSNGLLNLWYKNDNYKVLNGLADNKLCVIFCSGNGLYFPNTVENFREKIICNDRYEWGHVAAELIENVSKIVFIRDVRKSFYVTGISEKYNTIDKVIDLLKIVCEGCDVITAGNSAGGYMATILGVCLKARLVLNWGGQWNLYTFDKVVERYYFMTKYREEVTRSTWFNIADKFLNNTVPVLYFYAAGNEWDIQQAASICNLPNVYVFPLDSTSHGQGFTTETYINLIRCKTDNLTELGRSLSSKEIISVDELSLYINSLLPETGRYVIRNKELSAINKIRCYRDLLLRWVKWKQDGGYIGDWFLKHKKYGDIAVWGKGMYCDLLLRELRSGRGDPVKVSYIIETHPIAKEYEGIPVISIENLPDTVETVIVVPFYDIEVITEQIRLQNDETEIIGLDYLIELLEIKDLKGNSG